MSYNIIPSSRFKKEAKRLLKKYPSLKSELLELNKKLLDNPTLGASLGYNAYKIRLAIKSKGAGKSHEARVISYLITEEQEIYLLTIYDKADLDSIDEKTLKGLIENLNN